MLQCLYLTAAVWAFAKNGFYHSRFMTIMASEAVKRLEEFRWVGGWLGGWAEGSEVK